MEALQLRGNYWRDAIELAPRSPTGRRAKLCRVLWGEENTALTAIYVRLRDRACPPRSVVAALS